MLRFAGFELDRARAELRAADGNVVRLRPKAFDMLGLFAANPGRVVSKEELLEGIWPSIHVSDDSLFQCVREIRAALGDDDRRLLKVVSGRGYLFEATVEEVPPVRDKAGTDGAGPAAGLSPDAADVGTPLTHAPAGSQSGFPQRTRWFILSVAALALLAAAAVVAGLGSARFPGPSKPRIVVAVEAADGGDPAAISAANRVGSLLTDGLAGIDGLRVIAPGSERSADFLVDVKIETSGSAWSARARMTGVATGEVRWSKSVSIRPLGTAEKQSEARLTAGIGHELAIALNALGHPPALPSDASIGKRAKVAIEQATQSINRTTPERFEVARSMLEAVLAEDPDNVDLQVAFAALQLRGVQMAWYPPTESADAETSAGTVLRRALTLAPDYIPAQEAYCRYLSATNRFSDSLVACAKALTLDPWNGIALYHIGLGQLYMGRFTDAIATFRQAEIYDTPQVSRWTWTLGAGWASMLMGRAGVALPLLQRSIAITPASGRSHMLLAAAYQQLGRFEEAHAAMTKGMNLRPGSTAKNVPPPDRNSSPLFQQASARIMRLMVEAGLPPQ